MGTEEAIIYSYDIATVPSILPAFANKKDIIVVDEVCRGPCAYLNPPAANCEGAATRAAMMPCGPQTIRTFSPARFEADTWSMCQHAPSARWLSKR